LYIKLVIFFGVLLSCQKRSSALQGSCLNLG
jgi:hypothetical protein